MQTADLEYAIHTDTPIQCVIVVATDEGKYKTEIHFENGRIFTLHSARRQPRLFATIDAAVKTILDAGYQGMFHFLR